MARTAIVDLGSNSFRLVVFSYEPGGVWEVWDEIREPVRLGEGLGEGDRLREEPVERALETVRVFVAFCRQAGIDDVVATGTSALRSAANGPEVVARFEAEGLPVRVLDGEAEAYYGGLAILNTTSLRDGFGLDMGGGSVQLMRFSGAETVRSASLPLGAVRMTEAFLREESAKGRDALRKAVRKAVGGLAWFDGSAGAPIAGIGGAVRNLAGVAQRLLDLPNGSVQGFRLERTALAAVLEELAGRDVEGRRRLAGINPDRADVILAAAIVLAAILERGGFEELEITDAGLREGLFFERYFAGARPVFADVRRAGVRNLALRHGRDLLHAERVTAHALALYDGLADLAAIEPDPGARGLLESAALLHDIGRSIGFDQRHKHARYLISAEGLPGFSREDAATVADIVRYAPKGNPGEAERVALPAGILRVAEQLERSRAGEVDSLSVRAERRAIEIAVRSRSSASVGLWAAAHSADLLAEALGVPVRVAAGT